MVDCLRRSQVWCCAGTIAMVLAVVTTNHAQGVAWTVWDIGTLGGNYAVANDINDAGYVVGASSPPGGGAVAFLWTPSGGMRNLGVLGGLNSDAFAINNLGQVVGFSSQSNGSGVAFLWTAGGGMVSLGSLGGFSAAEDINDAGQVVGTGVSSNRAYAFLWTAAGGMIDIGTLGGSSTGARAINEAGQVVGQSDTKAGNRHAFIWTATGGMVDLGTLGGATSTASDINEAGQVVGRSQTASGAEHAFVWTAAGGMVDLGALSPAGSWSHAHGINDAGQVVGQFVADGYNRSFHWTAAEGMVELPVLTRIDSGAHAINNAGQATGHAAVGTTARHAVIWTRAVALPAPLAPVGLGVHSVVGNVVTLRWTLDPGGVAPTGFVLEGGGQPGDVLASVPTGSSALTFTFTAPSGSFYVRLHALNGTTRSAASNEIRIHVNVPVAPSAPANLLGLVNGSSLALAWTNTYTGGAPTSLVLDVTGSTTASIPLGLSDSFAFAPVPTGTYTLALRAQNAGGASVASNAVTLTFPGPCSGPPQTPASVRAYRVGNTVFIDWAPAPAGPAPTGYVVNVSGSFVGTVATAGRGLRGTVGSGSYTLTVAATNACGSSAPSAPQTVVVP